MLESLKKINKYKPHSKAVIISCFFNPQKSLYRTKAFNKFYNDIKHLNHYIIECVIGDSEPELKEGEYIKVVRSNSFLWHKEALLNRLIAELPEKYKYVFWLDADIIFQNKNWLVDSVKKLQTDCTILQPFEYCLNLDKDELKASFWLNQVLFRLYKDEIPLSFAATYKQKPSLIIKDWGRVGFAWGIRREALNISGIPPLYDRGLIGGADNIMAFASIGQIDHRIIAYLFPNDKDDIKAWADKFFAITKGKIDFIPGKIYHIWHGDIEKREYRTRHLGFVPMSKQIVEKDENGLYIAQKGEDQYIKEYFDRREVK